jgi:hypothetical protein
MNKECYNIFQKWREKWVYLSPVKNLTGTSAMQLQQPKVSGLR